MLSLLLCLQELKVEGNVLTAIQPGTKNITIPSEVFSIDITVFNGNKDIETVDFFDGNKILQLEPEQFMQCQNLKHINLFKLQKITQIPLNPHDALSILNKMG